MAPPVADTIAGKSNIIPVGQLGVMKLAESKVDVPEKFVKPIGERPTLAYNEFSEKVPVISLKGLNSSAAERARIVAEIGRACEEWGIFQILDHGVPEELMTEMMENLLAFFHLPVEEKLKYAADKKPGKFPVGYASGSHRSNDDILDWRELMVHKTLPLSIREQEINTWPESPETYRKVLVEYSDTLDKLVRSLLGLVSESLGLPTDYILNAVGGERAEQKLVANFYPQCPQPDLTLGLRKHTDYGTITVLQQGKVGGLQAFKHDKDIWVTVEPIPGALVVNLGDQTQILSNAKYCSVEHQAVVNSNETRLSLAVFASPHAMAQMGPAPELLSEENPAKYHNYTFKDYLPICYGNPTALAKTK